jgi:hypothetical protein
MGSGARRTSAAIRGEVRRCLSGQHAPKLATVRLPDSGATSGAPTILDVIEVTVLLSAISQWLAGFAARMTLLRPRSPGSEAKHTEVGIWLGAMPL